MELEDEHVVRGVDERGCGREVKAELEGHALQQDRVFQKAIEPKGPVGREHGDGPAAREMPLHLYPWERGGAAGAAREAGLGHDHPLRRNVVPGGVLRPREHLLRELMLK